MDYCTLSHRTYIYIYMFASTESSADSMARDLQMTGWIDYRTRAVLTEVFLYNPSVNYFIMVQVGYVCLFVIMYVMSV